MELYHENVVVPRVKPGVINTRKAMQYLVSINDFLATFSGLSQKPCAVQSVLGSRSG